MAYFFRCNLLCFDWMDEAGKKMNAFAGLFVVVVVAAVFDVYFIGGIFFLIREASSYRSLLGIFRILSHVYLRLLEVIRVGDGLVSL